jgi:hypothetical protein
VKKGGFRVSIIFPIAPHCLLTEEDDKVGIHGDHWKVGKLTYKNNYDQKKIFAKPRPWQ